MEAHQQRVVDECGQLNDRLEKLCVFIEDNPLFKTLNHVDQRLLLDQRQAMTVYFYTLRLRIERFNA